MRTRPPRGFTLLELMLVVAIIGMLAAIAIPQFLRFQARARQAEASSNLKTLFVGMRTQANLPQRNIRAAGFAPDRGNRYSYHLNAPCTNHEDRSGVDVVRHPDDDCVGVDTFKWSGQPSPLYTPAVPPAATWSVRGAASGLGVAAGLFGTTAHWDFIAYAAGDVDQEPGDIADTWVISSADGALEPACPVGSARNVPAGESFLVSNDVTCE